MVSVLERETLWCFIFCLTKWIVQMTSPESWYWKGCYGSTVTLCRSNSPWSLWARCRGTPWLPWPRLSQQKLLPLLLLTVLKAAPGPHKWWYLGHDDGLFFFMVWWCLDISRVKGILKKGPGSGGSRRGRLVREFHLPHISNKTFRPVETKITFDGYHTQQLSNNTDKR